MDSARPTRHKTRHVAWFLGGAAFASIGAGEAPPAALARQTPGLVSRPIARPSGELPPALPTAPGSPDPNPVAPTSTAGSRSTPEAHLTAPGDAPGTPLIPGQVIEPIDLASALKLAGARDLDIALAKERVCQAVAELDQARVLWLPSLYLGPNWIRHDGQVQTVQGQVINTSKSSLFLGGTAAAGSSVSGPVPAGGPAQVSGLTSILRFSDAIFEPLAARQVVGARRSRHPVGDQ